MKTGWDAWISIMQGMFSLSRGFPTTMRVKDGDIKSYRVAVETDDSKEQWSPKTVQYFIDHMNIIADEGGIDPPSIGEHEPELPSNMCAMHNTEGSSVDGTEDIS